MLFRCLVLECTALRGVRDRYNGLVGDHAAMGFTSCGNMILKQLCTFSHNVWTHTLYLALRVHAPDQPWVAVKDVECP